MTRRGSRAATERRLAVLRGGQLPQDPQRPHDRRPGQQPGLRPPRRAGRGRRRGSSELAATPGSPPPFGSRRSPWNRGIAFERRLKDEPDKDLLTLLREALDLDIAEAGYTDLNDVGGSAEPGTCGTPLSRGGS